MLERYPDVSAKYAMLAIQRSMVRILGAEKQSAPVFTGALRDRWNIEYGPLQGRIFSTSKYAVDVEYGTKPHTVSYDEIAPWAKKHGIPPWAVIKSIQQKGTKANPFFQKAIDSQRTLISKEFAQALASIGKELSKK